MRQHLPEQKYPKSCQCLHPPHLRRSSQLIILINHFFIVLSLSLLLMGLIALDAE